MGAPIAKKSLGTDDETGLAKEFQAFGLNINTDTDSVAVQCREVLIANGVNVKLVKTVVYTRFNSKAGQRALSAFNKMVTKDNLKFSELREDDLGKGIQQLIQYDIDKYDGSPQSLQQVEYTDAQQEIQS